MHEALAQIKAFAAGAVEHAAQVHGAALSLQHAAPGSLSAVEQILLALVDESCAAGFVTTDFCEPARANAFALPGTASYQASYVPRHLRIRSTRSGTCQRSRIAP